MDDERILDLYWQRSERAVAETDARYGGLLRSIAQNILRDAADAEECVSDAYLRAWTTIPPQRPKSLAAYLARIARNLSIDRLRRNGAAKRGGGAMERRWTNWATWSPAETTATAKPSARAFAASSPGKVRRSDGCSCAATGFWTKLPSWRAEPAAARAQSARFSRACAAN